MNKLIPIARYTDQDFFQYNDGTCMDIIKIISKDWLYAADVDRDYEIARWSKFYRLYFPNIQIVALNFKYNTSEQQEYLKKIIPVQRNPFLKSQLERKLKELVYIEENYTRREFFLFIYGRNEENMVKNRESVYELLKDLVEKMGYDDKKRVLFKMANKVSTIK